MMETSTSTEFATVQKSLESLEASISQVTNELKEGKTSQKAFSDEIKKLGDEQLKLAKGLQEISQSIDQADKNEGAVKSIGQAVATHEAVKSFGKSRRAMFEIDMKAAATSVAGNTASRTTISTPYQRPGIVMQPEQPLVVESLIPHIPVSSGAIEYLKEGAFTNNAGVAAEGTALKESTFAAPTLQVANVVNVGHYAMLTQQVIDDAAAYAAYIDAKMIYGLNSKVDQQIISGDGSATQLSGLLQTANHTDPATAISDMLETTSTLFDVALAIKAALENSYYTPEAFILNPTDWTKLCMVKDTTGRYILGGPQSVATKSLWGVPVVTTASLAAGKIILGNFTLGASIYDRQALTVSMTDSDAENFRSMVITVRVNRRLALVVEQPGAILAGAFTNPKAA